MSNDNVLHVPKKKSYTKKEKFVKEQEEIIQKLNIILGFNDKNNRFILEELKNNFEKQEAILKLEEDVKKYFSCSNWAYFKNLVSNEFMSLLRSIYKNTGYDIQYKKKMIKGEIKTEYYIYKKL